MKVDTVQWFNAEKGEVEGEVDAFAPFSVIKA